MKVLKPGHIDFEAVINSEKIKSKIGSADAILKKVLFLRDGAICRFGL